MRHVRDGVLRRLVDEPFAVTDRDIDHVEHCGRCQARRVEVLADAGMARELLVRPQAVPDVETAWHRVNEPGRAPARRVPGRVRSRRLATSTGVAVASGLLAAGVAAAATLTVVFSPTHVAPLPLSNADLQSLSSVLGAGATVPRSGTWSYGTIRWSNRPKPVTTASVQAAESAARMSITLPTSLPPGVSRVTTYVAVPASRVTVAFDAKAGPPLAGSTLSLTLGPALLAEYGGANAVTASGQIPALVVGDMQRPTATSTGATTAQLEAFVLSRRGFPQALAQEVHLLGNLEHVLPVPVPPGSTQTSTSVGGSPAVYLSLANGTAGGVVWEHDHVVHAVGGLVDQQEVMDVARQLG